jgi:hypothetical protein
MKRLLYRGLTSFILTMIVTMTCSFTCSAQNGPTNPSVTLSWTPSTTTSPAGTGICVYRGTSAGVYTKPALACSDTSTTGFTGCVAGVCTGYLDSSLTSTNRGTTYDYAVTEKFGSTTDSGYSNNAAAPIPSLNPPTLNTPVESGKATPPNQNKETPVASKSGPEAPVGLTAVVITRPAPGGLVATVNPGTTGSK